MLRNLLLISLLAASTATAHASPRVCEYKQDGPTSITQQLHNLLTNEALRAKALRLALQMNAEGCLESQILADSADAPALVALIDELYHTESNRQNRMMAAMILSELHGSRVIARTGLLDDYDRDATVRSMDRMLFVAWN